MLGLPLLIAPAVLAKSALLERELLGAVRSVAFDDVIDFGPVEDACCPSPARRTAHPPNVDVAVIELGPSGRLRQAANVLQSRDYPAGVVVPIDENLGASAVRFRRWDIDRWNGGTFASDGTQSSSKGWKDGPGLTPADDIVPGRESAPLEFMAPYPASLFKLMVAFHVLRLVDRGVVDLDARYAYDVPASCGGEAARTETNRGWLEAMITASNNQATCALLRQLHELAEIDAMNEELRELGLGTLQVNGTSPDTGGRWQPGEIHMTALDTARLLWLIEGAPGVLWRGEDGRPVTARVLSDASRDLLKQLLAEQGLNEALSTSNWCGLDYPAPGIPQLVPGRWIDARDGTVSVEDRHFGRDVRPCNARAEVTFAHKTGLTYNYGSDGGIVRSLPGRAARRYVIVFISNLGSRYGDSGVAGASPVPCTDSGVCYTEKIARLGRKVDDLFAGRGRPRRAKNAP
jgi:beta-lactamase class A